METLNHKRIKVPKPVSISTVLVAVAILCGFSTSGWSQRPGVGGKRNIDVATLNLYVGSEFTSVLTLNPADPDYGRKLLTGVATIYGHIVASNFPVRADAMAIEIVAHGPDLVALQEVSLIRRQSPGDAIFGGTSPATKIDADYLAILMAAIARRGGHYSIASQVQDTDVEVPMATGPASFDDVRITDRDVILMRTDLPPGYLNATNPQHSNFAAYLPLPVGINILRGWCSLDVQVRGRWFRFINTHLEEALPAPIPNIQLGQAAELLAGPMHTSLPVIVAGDFNSDPYGHYSTDTYLLLTGLGGLTDAWSEAARPEDLGLTWGHDELLSNPLVPFVFRLDLLLYRGLALQATDASVVDPVIGTSPPLWFSDHAAEFATLAIQ